MSKEKCAVCGEISATHKIKDVPFTYKGKSTTIQQPGLWCETCGEGMLSESDMRATMKDMQAHKATVDGLITPDEIKKIRKKIKLSQKEAAYCFGGGVNGFSRYERGETPPPKPLSVLLKVLDKHPSLLDEVRAAGH